MMMLLEETSQSPECVTVAAAQRRVAGVCNVLVERHCHHGVTTTIIIAINIYYYYNYFSNVINDAAAAVL